MSDTLAARCLRRQKELETHRMRFEPLWHDAAKRVLPVQAGFFGDESPAERIDMDKNFDSTAMLALGKFAAAVESITTPRNAKWHNLTPSDPDLAEDVDVSRWCDTVRDRLFAVRGRKSANFSSAFHEGYRSLGVFGHGPKLVQHDLGKGIRYISIPVREIWIGADAANVVDTVHRQYELTVRQALQEFDESELPQDILACRNSPGELNKTIRLLHCVFPNPDYDPDKADRAGARFMRYRSIHLWRTGEKVLRDSGYRTMPYLVPRYETIPGSPYGFGPALLMLPEIKMVNEMGKTIIRAAHLATSPPLLLKDDDMLSPFSITPDALNFGGLDDQGRPAVRPLEMGQRYDIGFEFLNTRQMVINDAFLVNLFQILVDQPQMTATEVVQRASEKGELLAPTMGRLQAEDLAPCIERELDIFASVPGLLPPMPPQLAEAGGLVAVEYASPLAKTQAAGEVLGTMRTFEAALPMAQVDPSVMDVFNFDEMLRGIARANNASFRALRTPEEVDTLREQKARAQQAQSMLAAAPALAGAAKDMAEAQSLAGLAGSAAVSAGEPAGQAL